MGWIISSIIMVPCKSLPLSRHFISPAPSSPHFFQSWISRFEYDKSFVSWALPLGKSYSQHSYYQPAIQTFQINKYLQSLTFSVIKNNLVHRLQISGYSTENSCVPLPPDLVGHILHIHSGIQLELVAKSHVVLQK